MSDVVFYHGTRRGFSQGGYLLPAMMHKAQPRPGNTEPEHVYEKRVALETVSGGM